jgi:hypothetical protein
MDLRAYVEKIHRQLVVAADAGGDDARALAERLVAPLDAAIRLTLQDALSVAAEEITCELAPGSVELRLRGPDLEFVVTPPAAGSSNAIMTDDAGDADEGAPGGWRLSGATSPGGREGDEGSMSRINLRLPDHLKSRIEHAAGNEGLSVNAWLVRAAGATLDRRADADRPRPPAPSLGTDRYTGWAR